MKRKILFIVAVLLITAGLFLFMKVLDSFKTPGRGALQVTTSISATVFLDGKEIGKTPLCKCSENDTIPSGKYELRIEPSDTTLPAFTTKVSINGGVLTAVERTFLPGAYASASILTLEKTDGTAPELIVTTLPEGTLVTVDSVPQGATPYRTDSLSVSEHELKLSKEGFQTKTIRIRMVENHRLVIQAYLGASSDEVDQLIEAQQEEEEEEDATEEESATTITILDTPTGFLRVRSGAGAQFSEIKQIAPGEEYELVSETDGWYEIALGDGETGWVSEEYAEKD